MENKKTVGHHAYELLTKPEAPINIIDQQEAMQAGWGDQITLAIERGLKEFTGDFYIVIETKKERLMENVLRNYFIVRASCPTPTTDQAVYKLHHKEEKLQFLWVIPSIDTISYLKSYALSLPPSEYDILRYVLSYEDGSLLKLAKKLNNEQIDSPLLAKG